MIIHKEICQVDDPLKFELWLHPKAKILTAQLQDSFISIWYLWDELMSRDSFIYRKFRWVKTGEKFEGGLYIATVQIDGWVGHLFEVK